jgi:hypothetical protein
MENKALCQYRQMDVYGEVNRPTGRDWKLSYFLFYSERLTLHVSDLNCTHTVAAPRILNVQDFDHWNIEAMAEKCLLCYHLMLQILL